MSTQEFSTLFSALSDPTRLSIVRGLRAGSCNVGEIVRLHNLSGATITRHLDILERAGLVRREKRGQERICALNPEGFRQVQSWLTEFESFWNLSLDNLDVYLSTEKTDERQSNNST